MPPVLQSYNTRETRHKFIAENFKEYLNHTVLNIGGGGERHLLKFIQPEEYFELDISGTPDLKINLDKVHPLPIEDGAFDAVICTDVLEHLDEFHRTFYELLRISDRYVIVSLPNSLKVFPNYFRHQKYIPNDASSPGVLFGKYSKFYGLPLEKPGDRHRWFFSYSEAESFFNYHAEKLNYRIVFEFGLGLKGESWRGNLLRGIARRFLNEISFKDMFASTYWCVIEKRKLS